MVHVSPLDIFLHYLVEFIILRISLNGPAYQFICYTVQLKILKWDVKNMNNQFTWTTWDPPLLKLDAFFYFHDIMVIAHTTFAGIFFFPPKLPGHLLLGMLIWSLNVANSFQFLLSVQFIFLQFRNVQPYAFFILWHVLNYVQYQVYYSIKLILL